MDETKVETTSPLVAAGEQPKRNFLKSIKTRAALLQYLTMVQLSNFWWNCHQLSNLPPLPPWPTEPGDRAAVAAGAMSAPLSSRRRCVQWTERHLLVMPTAQQPTHPASAASSGSSTLTPPHTHRPYLSFPLPPCSFSAVAHGRGRRPPLQLVPLHTHREHQARRFPCTGGGAPSDGAWQTCAGRRRGGGGGRCGG